jgi:hypothetical protein
MTFESDPIWMWSIRPNSWATMFITGPDKLRLRQDHPSLFTKVMNKCVNISSTFAVETISPDVMWISGTKCFIDQVSLPPVGTHVYVLLKGSRRCPSDLDHIRWTRLTHRHVGGVTNARGSFGVDTRSNPLVVERDLSRSLGHIMKYSIRPRVCNPIPDEPHYVTTDSLSLSFPRRPVLYPTFMSRTGWGIRPLSDLELSACFELPEYVAWEDRFLRDLIPLQLCRSVIDSVTHATTLDPPRVKSRLNPSVEDMSLPSFQDVIWLPSVEKWLPGTWADATISDKAVKSDNAPVDFRPWHRRIQLISHVRLTPSVFWSVWGLGNGEPMSFVLFVSL